MGAVDLRPLRRGLVDRCDRPRFDRAEGPYERRRKSRWTAQRVRKILENAKYVGVWRWGHTLTLRNSKGKTRQQPVPAGQGVTHQRPDLRIIQQETWEKAQQRLRELKESVRP